jgi:hypothetical protein
MEVDMLSFRALSEKKTKIKINPKQSEITEMEKNHGEDCDCMKCEKKRRKEGGEKEVATEAKYYDPMEDPDFDHDEAERTRGQSGKPAKKKKTTKEETAYVSQEEVSEESNQSIDQEETSLLTFGQFSEGMSLKQAAMGESTVVHKMGGVVMGKTKTADGKDTVKVDDAPVSKSTYDFMQKKGMNKVDSSGKPTADTTYDERKAAGLKTVKKVEEALTGERYKKAVKKPGGIAYSRMVSADPKKRATRGGRGGESDFGAGDRGSGNKAARRAGTYQEEYVDEGIRSTIAAAGLSAAVAAHGGIGKKAETHKSPAPEKSQATQVSKKKETKSPEQIWREKHPNLAAKEDSKKKPASVKSQLSDIGDMIARSKARQQNNSFEPKGELVDERTRYAKETGKDFQTGKPSEKGGTLGGDDRHSKVMRHMQKDLRKSGGLMSSRGKPIKPQGKKNDKGAKPSFKMEPTSVDKIKAKLAQKRKPKPDISSRFD